MAFEIDPIKCPQDHKCLMLNYCPGLAISQEAEGLPVIDTSKCFECRNCTYYCPNGAVKRKEKNKTCMPVNE